MTVAILHAGLHKTGSTSIQETLRANSKKFQRAGYCTFPQLPANKSSFFMARFSANANRYHAFVKLGYSGADVASFAELNEERIRNAARGRDYQSLVFSGEDASVLKPHELEEVKEFLLSLDSVSKAKIILYARHPIDYIRSAAQQHVQTAGLNVDDALNLHIGRGIGFRRRIGNFVSVFGRENVSVFSFEEAAKSHSAGVVGHFLEQLDLPDDLSATLRAVRSNASMSHAALLLITFLNQDETVMKTETDRKWVRVLREIRGTKACFFGREHATRALASTQDEFAYLRDEFGIRYDEEIQKRAFDPTPDVIWTKASWADLAASRQKLSPLVWRKIDEYFRQARSDDRAADKRIYARFKKIGTK